LSAIAISQTHAPTERAARAARLDRFELALLAIFAALSLWTIGLALYQVLAHGRIWTGSENVFFVDGFQSMMWIEGILHHGASPDLYVLRPTAADFFQPLIAISAAVTALGVPSWVSLLVWKPVAVGGAFLALWAYLRRVVTGEWARRAALALALFFGWGAVIGDSSLVFWSWGYPLALIGLACALGALLAYARDRKRGSVGLLAPALGAMASWLHPWQGETLILVLLGTELCLLARRQRVPVAALALTVAVTALPLAYFALLVKLDPVWRYERQVALSTYPFSHVAGTLWPLAIPALLAYRVRPASFLELSARVWLPVALVLFWFSEWQGSGATHALLGVTVPLGALAVEGLRSLPWRRVRLPRRALAALAVALLAAVTIPGMRYLLDYARQHVEPQAGRATFITRGENAALSYLARDRRAGGVLTSFYLGALVPPRTGRNTYLGDCYWSQPNCGRRSDMVNRLLAGKLGGRQARAFVLSTGARFVLGDCRSRDLQAALASITSDVRRFSCATLYTIR
jgi:hypothetical protein